jgi:hypothetical protein
MHQSARIKNKNAPLKSAKSLQLATWTPSTVFQTPLVGYERPRVRAVLAALLSTLSAAFYETKAAQIQRFNILTFAPFRYFV